MIDRNATIEDPATAPAEPPPEVPERGPETLEQRVHRLEDAVAALQDTHLIEERVTERVMGRMKRKPEPASTGIMEAERRTHAPAANENHPADTPADPAPTLAPVAKQSWVLTEVFRDVRAVFAMFFDPRYRVSWSALFALMLLAYVLVSHWLWTLWSVVPILGLLSGPMSLVFIGPLLDKAVGLFLALFAFKILSRELARYREALARPSSSSPHY